MNAAAGIMPTNAHDRSLTAPDGMKKLSVAEGHFLGARASDPHWFVSGRDARVPGKTLPARIDTAKERYSPLSRPTRSADRRR